MASKTRLANKTIWALEDIIAHCQNARRAYETLKKQARQQMDPLAMLALIQLSDDLAAIERKAINARQGKYEE
jgi:hypothetical protein